MLDHQQFLSIKAFFLDVDGVLTNGDVLIMEDGSLLRTMNVRDGLAIKRAKDAGYTICIITKGASKGVKSRLLALGVDEVCDKLTEKVGAMQYLTTKYNLQKEEILYMGDDLPDIAAFAYAGISSCPHDAAHEVAEVADYVSGIKGGQGCVREVIERTMRIQGTWTLEYPSTGPVE